MPGRTPPPGGEVTRVVFRRPAAALGRLRSGLGLARTALERRLPAFDELAERLRPRSGWALGAQLAAGVGVLALCAGGSLAQVAAASPPQHVVIRDPDLAHRPAAALLEQEVAAPPLPPAAAPPAPPPPQVASAPVLRPHEVFGFAPYWTLPSAGAFDLAHLTTLAYFGVDAAADGSLVQSGPGWTGYQSQALADLVNRAHAAGDRVVLSVECFDQAALDRLSSDPAADQHLADSIVAAVQAKSMDGANIDFEGLGSADRAGMARLVSYLSARLHQANPHWQVTVDTYSGSATDPGGFFDVAAMAPSVDAFFVMAYDMERSANASPNAPLTGRSPSDAQAVAGYLSAVPASKVILGVPFYGYQWSTADNSPGSAATSGPQPVTYAQLRSTSAPVYWDSQSDVPWTAFQDPQGQWHEAYFDDPHSVSLKAQLADSAHLAGVGIWALGMDGNDPAMMAALVGRAQVVKTYSAAPSASSTTTSTSSTSPTTTSTTAPATTTSTTRPKPSSGTGSGTGSGGSSPPVTSPAPTPVPTTLPKL